MGRYHLLARMVAFGACIAAGSSSQGGAEFPAGVTGLDAGLPENGMELLSGPTRTLSSQYTSSGLGDAKTTTGNEALYEDDKAGHNVGLEHGGSSVDGTSRQCDRTEGIADRGERLAEDAGDKSMQESTNETRGTLFPWDFKKTDPYWDDKPRDTVEHGVGLVDGKSPPYGRPGRSEETEDNDGREDNGEEGDTDPYWKDELGRDGSFGPELWFGHVEGAVDGMFKPRTEDSGALSLASSRGLARGRGSIVGDPYWKDEPTDEVATIGYVEIPTARPPDHDVRPVIDSDSGTPESAERCNPSDNKGRSQGWDTRVRGRRNQFVFLKCRGEAEAARPGEGRRQQRKRNDPPEGGPGRTDNSGGRRRLTDVRSVRRGRRAGGEYQQDDTSGLGRTARQMEPWRLPGTRTRSSGREHK